MFNNASLSGLCSIKIGKEQRPNTPCRLNLEDKLFECYVDIDENYYRAKFDDTFEISNVELISPAGVVKASIIDIGFLSHLGGGTISIAQSPITHITGILPRVRTLKFVVNKPIVFQLDNKSNETYYFPAYDISGTVETNIGLSIQGSKYGVSIHGDLSGRELNVRTALGMAVGAPMREFAILRGGELTLYLNNYGFLFKPRPLFDQGYPFRDIDKSQKGLSEIFEKSLTYLEKISKQEASGMRNAVQSYLEGRVISGSFELKLFAAFYFLEWFDNSRTMSSNILQVKLGISRDEAEGIILIRNELIHNKKDIEEIVRLGVEKIKIGKIGDQFQIENFDPAIGFLNYIYSLTGQRLLEFVGYNGPTQDYFPRG